MAATNARKLLALGDAGLLVAVAVLAFLPALGNGWIWDDDDYVTANPTLTSAHGLTDIWFDPAATPQYYPLVHSGFWIERRVWGDRAAADGDSGPNPFGYHLDNVLLHALVAVLFWRVLARLRAPGAWLAALLFAVHPVTVESVAWVTERKNVLSAVFYLGAALAWLRFARLSPIANGEAAAGERSAARLRWGALALAFLLYGAALLSKSVTASLPAALALVLWWKHGRLPRRELLSLLAMLPLGLIAGLHTAALERVQVRAQGPYWDQSLVESLLIAGRSCWHYMQKLFVPFDLAFFYERWKPDPGLWWWWLFPLGALALVAALWAARTRLGRGPLVAVLFFGGTLIPALGFLNVYPHRYSWTADHFQYHACLGVFALFAAGLARTPLWRARAGAPEPGAGLLQGRRAWPAFAMAGALAAGLGARTWQQCSIYADQETLWTDTVAKTPTAYAAWRNLGMLHIERGDVVQGTEYYRKALALDPHDPEGLYGEQTWEAKFGMSMLRLHEGRYADAVRFAEEALAIDGPGAAPEQRAYALLNIGAGRVLLREYREALSPLREAGTLLPGFAPADAYFGEALARLGRTGEAVAALSRALAANPGELDALLNLSWIRSAHTSERFRNPASALELADRADQVARGQDARAHDARAGALAAAGRYPEAAAALERGLVLAR
ncbi:MAG TPA: tetratricopeptide repeat protein, partial [Planctomycetota bacterium]